MKQTKMFSRSGEDTCCEDKQGKGQKVLESAIEREGQGCFLKTFDCGLEEGERASLLSIWGKINPDRGNSKFKGPGCTLHLKTVTSPVRLGWDQGGRTTARNQILRIL